MPEVSVVIPLFGRHHGLDTLPDVCAGWLDQEIDCEVVVAVAGELPVRVPAGVRVIPADETLGAPGTLRNVAARQARSGWLYLTDADVRPIGRDFLSRCLGLAGPGGAVTQPWMYRLVGAGVSAGPALLAGLPEGRRCLVQPGPSGTAVAVPEERFVMDGEDLMVEPPAAMLAAAGPGELRWRPAFHWGAMLIERATFDQLGGYCEQYVGWGCEDDDLLAKVRATAPLTIAWRVEETLRCLHFEHARPYDSPEFAANRAILAARTAAGPERMVDADRLGLGRRVVA
jgi:hypothetical protein